MENSLFSRKCSAKGFIDSEYFNNKIIFFKEFWWIIFPTCCKLVCSRGVFCMDHKVYTTLSQGWYNHYWHWENSKNKLPRYSISIGWMISNWSLHLRNARGCKCLINFEALMVCAVPSRARVTKGCPSSSCEMIILRNNSHGEIIRACMGIFTTALRNKKICQILTKNTPP